MDARCNLLIFISVLTSSKGLGLWSRVSCGDFIFALVPQSFVLEATRARAIVNRLSVEQSLLNFEGAI